MSYQVTDHRCRKVTGVPSRCRQVSALRTQDDMALKGMTSPEAVGRLSKISPSPTPSGNYEVCVQPELSCNTGCALQARVFHSLKVMGAPMLKRRVAQYWILHSGRNCLTSAAAAFKVPNDTVMFGGWTDLPVSQWVVGIVGGCVRAVR